MALLRRHRLDLPPDDPNLIALAEELGDLPLALHLAGSFLEHYRHAAFGTPAAYLAELRQADLLAHRSLTAGGYSPTGHEQHVARTFALSYDRLKPDDATDALALKLLARAACFAPGVPIPRDLLCASLPGSAEGEGEAEIRREDALARLSELGLLEAQDMGALVLHRLLAMFVRREVGEVVATEARAAVEAAVFAAAARVNQEGYPASLSALEPHVRAVAEGAAARKSKWASSLYNELGHHLVLIADFAGAQQAYKQALQLDEKIIGPDHPDIVLRLNNWCSTLRRGGDLVEARTGIERALAIGRRTLDPEHFHLTSAMTNLAATLGDEGNLARTQGDVAGARAVFQQAQAILEQVLAIWRRTFGPEDLRVGTLLTSLSQIMLGLGNPAGARVVAEQALQIKEKTLGPEHPDVAFCLNNLAGTLLGLGDLIGARAACRRALAVYEHTYGLDHRSSRLVRGNLAALEEKGSSMTGDTIHMSGDFRGANVFVKSTLSNVSMGVRNMVGVDDAAKAELQALVAQLNDALQRVPPEKREEAEAVAASAKQLVQAAEQENPNRPMLRIAAAGLKQGAQMLVAAAPKVLTIADGIVDLIGKVRDL